MMRPIIAITRLAALLAILLAQVVFADQTLISPGSIWKYNDAGIDLGTAWRASAYNDSSWASGPAELGYGDGGEATVLSYGGNAAARHITYYFRHGFTVAMPATISALTLRVVRDDGCIVYLNGTEVARSNLPAGSVSFTTLASAAVGGADETAWQQFSIDPALLVAGTNVIAIELHQQSAASSDISLDVELLAAETVQPGPSVTLQTPPDQDLSNQTTVTFTGTASAPAGLSSATLLVGDPPVTTVFAGPAQIVDTQLTAGTPSTPAGSAVAITVDGQSPHAHGLISAPALIGVGSGQVPSGAFIASATLSLNCTNAGNQLAIFRLTQDWTESEATWNSRSSGMPWTVPGADGPGSNAGVALPGECTATGQRLIDITPFVQEWSNGTPNFGVVLTDTGADGVSFDSSESGNTPQLTVTYHADQAAVATQPLSGTESALSLSTSLPVGTHYWNIEVEDINGSLARAAAAFEVTVDPTYPDLPLLVTPPDGAEGLSPGLPLAAWVSDPAGGTLTAQVALRKAPGPEFTIVALPDTQFYSQLYPDIFTSQTQWIVDNKESRNIVFVTHEGDLVQNAGVESEWQAANNSMSLLDGVVPYGMGPGNHDQPTDLYNDYFGYERYEAEPWYGGHYENKNDNNFQLFSSGGIDFVMIHLEFCPSAGAIAWADGVLKNHSQRIGILTTHGYLDGSAQRTVGSCSSTQYIWDGLALPNPNLHFMLSGHVHAESRRTDIANGHPVHQMLADYQGRTNGGNGWLRILRFVPAEDKVHVQTYSPWLDQYETDANSQFSLDFTMGAPFSNIGTVAVQSGALAVLSPPGLLPFTEYEWQMTVTNTTGKSRVGQALRFTTGVNLPPPDLDGDGVADVIDNCTSHANPHQHDSDGDHYGNVCDGDLSNNGFTNAQDFVLFRQQLGQPSTAPAYNVADLNTNGFVNAQDYILFRQLLGLSPGPSALAP